MRRMVETLMRGEKGEKGKFFYHPPHASINIYATFLI
jgi:hypothetical protein